MINPAESYPLMSTHDPILWMMILIKISLVIFLLNEHKHLQFTTYDYIEF